MLHNHMMRLEEQRGLSSSLFPHVDVGESCDCCVSG